MWKESPSLALVSKLGYQGIHLQLYLLMHTGPGVKNKSKYSLPCGACSLHPNWWIYAEQSQDGQTPSHFTCKVENVSCILFTSLWPRSLLHDPGHFLVAQVTSLWPRALPCDPGALNQQVQPERPHQHTASEILLEVQSKIQVAANKGFCQGISIKKN